MKKMSIQQGNTTKEELIISRKKFLCLIVLSSIELGTSDLLAAGKSTKQNYIFTTPFRNPKAIAADMHGNIYAGCCAINGGALIKLKYLGKNQFDTEWTITISQVRGIAVDENNYLYVTCIDDGQHEIRKYDEFGNLKMRWGEIGNGNKQFTGPTGILYNHANKIYVTETGTWPLEGGCRIQVFDKEGNYLQQWGQKGYEIGMLNNPTGISCDINGNIFILDSYNSRVQVFDHEGNFISCWGKYGSMPGELNCPQGIAIDKNDVVYIADTYNNRIQTFTKEGRFISSIGKYGNTGGEFWLPCGIAIDKKAAMLYVADSMNDRILVITIS
jgi:DNA-binding beta-propeller fold protein YncE